MESEGLTSAARDIHAERPARALALRRVGGLGLKVPLRTPRGDVVLAEVDLLITLPSWRRGVDLSRQNRSLYEALRKSTGALQLARNAAELILENLDYAETAEVIVRYESAFKAGPMDSYEPYREEARVRLSRSGDREESLAVERTATTACPCTQELLRAWGELSKQGQLGLATHTQRAVFRLEVRAERVEGATGDDLLRVIETAASSPVRAVLKRPQEAELVVQMLKNARLVEDAVREMLAEAARLPLPEEAVVTASVRAQESVHAHDIYAEGSHSVREIRESLGA